MAFPHLVSQWGKYSHTTFGDTTRKLARQLAVPLVDVHAAFTAKNADKLLLDGMHPNDAGQYFTPRVLIQSIVRCMRPDPRAHREFTICDPACGTGGFLVAAYEWLIQQTKGRSWRAKSQESETPPLGGVGPGMLSPGGLQEVYRRLR